jgi:hypothetical protein
MELAWEEEPDTERDAALGRVFGALLSLAEYAHQQVYGETTAHGLASRWSGTDMDRARLVGPARSLSLVQPDLLGEVHALLGLGEALLGQGQLDPAESRLHDVLGIFDRCRMRLWQARALEALADAQATGDQRAAEQARQQAERSRAAMTAARHHR